MSIEINIFDALKSEFKGKLDKYISEQLALGRSKEDILKELEESQKSGTGLYHKLMGEVPKYRWDLKPCTKGEEEAWNEWALIDNKILHDGDVEYLEEDRLYCDSCLYQAGRGELDIGEFPVPGNQPTHGRSNCGEYCTCNLEKVKN